MGGLRVRRRKLAVIEQFLTSPARDAARQELGLAPLPRKSNNNNGIECAVSIPLRIRDKQCIQVCRRGAQNSVGESDQETESHDSDPHARMAKMLFGLEAGTTQIVNPSVRRSPGGRTRDSSCFTRAYTACLGVWIPTFGRVRTFPARDSFRSLSLRDGGHQGLRTETRRRCVMLTLSQGHHPRPV
jgi:hypothetical protein